MALGACTLPPVPGTHVADDAWLVVCVMPGSLASLAKTQNHLPAGKFILFQMERARSAGADGAALEARLSAADFSSQAALEALPLAERWIVTRVHQVTAVSALCMTGHFSWQLLRGSLLLGLFTQRQPHAACNTDVSCSRCH